MLLRRSVFKALLTPLAAKGSKNMPFGEARTLGFNNQPLARLLVANSIINKNGLFFYSGTPAFGNLLGSLGVATSGIDKFGNAYITGDTIYWNSGGTFYALGLTSSFPGLASYNAATSAGPYFRVVPPPMSAASIAITSNDELALTAKQILLGISGQKFIISPSGDTTGAKDTSNINNALITGAEIHLLAGTYYINTAISLTSNAILTGAGQATQILCGSGFTAAGPMIQLASTAAVNTTIRGFGLNGNSNTHVTDGVHLDNGAPGTGGHLVENITVTGVGSDGYFLGTIRDSKIRNCYASLNIHGNGFTVGGSDTQISGCTAGQNFGHGFNILGSNHTVIGNKAFQNGWNGSAYTGTTACGIYNSSQFTSIVGNSCQQNALHGIELDGTVDSLSFNCTVTGNECDTNSIATLNTGNGIHVNQAQFCTITGNHGSNNAGITGSQLWGIFFTGTCTGTVASPNIVSGSSGLFNGSTGWTNPAPNAGFSSTGAGGNTVLGYKSIGDRLLLRGVVNLTANQAAFATIFTLPAGTRPAFNHNFATPNTLSGYTAGGISITVNNLGAVQIGVAGSNANFVVLDGIVLTLD